MKKKNNYESCSLLTEYWIRALKIMKISVFLLLISITSVYASSTYSQSTKLTASLKNATIEQVFDLIQSQSEFIIFYRDDQVNVKKEVSVDVKESTVDRILDQALENTNLEYKIYDRQIVIIPGREIERAEVILDDLKAEQRTKKVTGKVLDTDGNPIPGVSVLVKGTTIGTVTDINGIYSLNVEEDSETLQFSFVGMISIEKPLAGTNEINVTMESDAQDVEEVVVTALGIQRNKKALTYASQQVTGDEMMKSRDINFMNSLSGKTAGMEIRKSTSGAGGATRTVLRGAKSVSSLSSPLYVIDGVPIANNKPSGAVSIWGGADEGDGISQINPDDIESISVLKGATAAILYGSQGANGVIIINTKSGKEGRTTVSFSSSATFEQVNQLPDFQYRYGAENGAFESWSYTKGNYADNYIEDFFETGHNLVNSLSVSGGNKKSTSYFSYSNTSSAGVIPNNSYNKHNLSFKQTLKLLDDKITITSNIMLTQERTKNRNRAGYYLNPMISLYLFPRSGATPLADQSLGAQSMDYYKENYSYYRSDRNITWQNWFVEGDHFQSNPYWLVNKQPKEDLTKRFIGNISLEYQVIKDLKLQVRGSYDYSARRFEQKFYAGGNSVNVSSTGTWYYKKYDTDIFYTDALLTYKKQIGDFDFTGILGVAHNESISDGISTNNGTVKLMYANEFYMQNLPTNVMVSSTGSARIIQEGVFGNFDIGYKNMLFLNLSGRNDWSSTLAGTGNESYFYPSVGLTGVISEMADLPSFISFAKVRGSGSTINNSVGYGVVTANHSISNANGTISRNTRLPFTTARPEKITTYELGADLRFLDNRLALDFTYYDITSKNMSLSRAYETDEGSIYTSEYFNAGEITNKGVEITLNATPVQSKNFSWNTSLNYSKNKNKVVSLYPDDDTKYASFGSNEGYYAMTYKGGSIGDAYAIKFKRDDEGRILLDEDTHAPLRTDTWEYVGKLEPKFSLGWSNSFNYKQFSLGFLVNAKVGGKCFSVTQMIMDGYGVSEVTAAARDRGYVKINGITETSGTVVTEVDPETYYTAVGNRYGIAENYVYDRTNIRLTQLSLTYNFDVRNLGLPVEKASLSFVGQDLFFFYKDAPYDPELTMGAGSLSVQSVDAFATPGARTFGFNLNVTF
ncbi:SusC/RagA family TonB-linked outer membrane protein [Maribellus maritimus]|uniref:SusC/RagA family TonB-linked outer membrane protein n=1 Tax=Maribellus maritimus TaxID=2870838 RepID=UPI001EEA4064|nr:SusC/RagA family TonB-linked outer membrane protein [Maribellus maritimus]MCG6190054.1 SusC/RagA family TonB-linked outer membrane protein [Maribellus maritimus]